MWTTCALQLLNSSIIWSCERCSFMLLLGSRQRIVHVKKAVVISAAYVGLFLISLTLLTAVSLIFNWIINYSPVYHSSSFMQNAVTSTWRALPVAVALSLMLILLVRTRSRRRAPLLSIVISVLAIALYAGLAFLLMQLSPQSEVTRSSSLPFYEQRLVQIEETLLYTGQIRNVDSSYLIEPLLRIDLNAQQAPRVSYYQQGTAYPAQNRILDAEESPIIEYTQSEIPFFAFAAPPILINRILTEIGGVNSALQQSAARGWVFLLITTAAHVLFLTGSWSIIRSSRWPLLNALLSLLVLRGFFFLDAAFRGGIFAEVLKVLSLEQLSFLAAPAAFLLLGFLFTLWGLVYNPAPKEADHE